MAISAPWVGTAVQGNVAGSNVSTITVDVSGATNGEVVWIFGTLGDAEIGTIATPAGWSLLGQTSEGTSGGSSSRTVIFWKVKDSGDTNVVITDATNWTVATKPQFVAVSWPGVDTTTPAENLTWLAHTSGTTYTTGTATPASIDRWAVGVFSARGSTASVAWTPDAALTERVDVVNSSTVFVGLEIADSNGVVTAASHSYTATSQSASHGLGGLFYLIPAATTVRLGSQHPGATPGRGIRFWRKRPAQASQPAIPTGVKGFHSIAASSSVSTISTVLTNRTVAGDLGVAIHAYNPATEESPTPGGWTLVDTLNVTATAHMRIYKKVLTLAEAGSNLTFTNALAQRLSAGCIVLDGTVYSDIDVFLGATDLTSQQAHASPVTPARTAPGIELNFFAQRSSLPSNAVTPPPASALATQAFGVGSGSTGVAIAVNGAQVVDGVPAGGGSWIENVANGNNATWTLAIIAVTAAVGVSGSTLAEQRSHTDADGVKAAVGSTTSTQRAGTSSTGVKTTSSTTVDLQRSTTTTTDRKTGVGAGTDQQRTATTVTDLKTGVGAALDLQRSTTSSSGTAATGVTGVGVTAQRSSTSSTGRKTGASATFDPQRSATLETGRKSAAAAAVDQQRSSSTVTGLKTEAGAVVDLQRSATLSTGAQVVGIGGAGRTTQRSSVASTGRKTATVAAVDATGRAVTTSSGTRRATGVAVAATRSHDRAGGLRATSGTARVSQRCTLASAGQQFALFTPLTDPVVSLHPNLAGVQLTGNSATATIHPNAAEATL